MSALEACPTLRVLLVTSIAVCGSLVANGADRPTRGVTFNGVSSHAKSLVWQLTSE